MKCHHPDIFCAAILNAQPMGFYAPSTLVRDARQHGVEIRPVDVNHSEWDTTLEVTGGKFLAVRLGLRMTRELAEKDGKALVAARNVRPYQSVPEIARRAGIGVGALVRLAKADAFRSMGLSRRQALWAIRGLRNEALPLFAAAEKRAQ